MFFEDVAPTSRLSAPGASGARRRKRRSQRACAARIVERGRIVGIKAVNEPIEEDSHATPALRQHDDHPARLLRRNAPLGRLAERDRGTLMRFSRVLVTGATSDIGIRHYFGCYGVPARSERRSGSAEQNC